MNSELPSLSNLRDIAVPDPPASWPPAPGVWLLLGVFAALVLTGVWRWHETRRRSAYRRAGLALLADAQTAQDVAVILKRVALAAFPRERVASLYGADWIAFLNATCSAGDFGRIGIADVGSPASPEMVQLAGEWIRHHRVAAVPIELR